MNGFSSGAVGKLTGLNHNSVRGLTLRGFAGPEYGSRGGWSMRQVIGLKVLHDARKQGASVAAAVVAYDLVRGMGEARMAEYFVAGRRVPRHVRREYDPESGGSCEGI